MARRVSVALLAAAVGLTVLVPVVGIVAMVMTSIALAIALEQELVSDEPAGLAGPVTHAVGAGRVSGRPGRLTE
jgi:hypothetical protein